MKSKLYILFVIISTALFAQQKPKVGLVLSGGGAKGIAHIGVIRVLESKGIKPDYIVGTSFGALVGAFYAIGYTPDEMEKMIQSRDWDFLLNDQIKRKNVLIGQGDKNKNTLFTIPLDGLKPEMASGLFKGQNILTFFDIMTRDYNRLIDFDSLKIPFRCIGTNIETGEAKIFSKGILPEALRASMSIPSIFSPYEIDGELYVDGGIVNNFPTDVVKEMGADIIIGVDVGAVLYKKEEINSILRILDQTSSFYNYRVAQENKKLCDIYIRPNIDGISAMGFDEIDTIIDRGYIAAMESADKIDSIFGKYNLQPIADSYKYFSTNRGINVDDVIIRTNISSFNHKKGSERLTKGKLKLETPTVITENELSNKLNRLYGSKYFSKIKMEFEPQTDSSYTIILDIHEKKQNDFSIGARYDYEYGVNLLLAAQFRNLMIYGSLLEIGGIIGQSPQVKLRYTTDRGRSIGYGTSTEYNYFTVNSYIDGEKFAEYSYNRIVWDAFIHSYIGDYNRIVLGTEVSFFGLSKMQSVSDLAEINERFLNVYAAYIVDTYDRAYYPNSGFKLRTRGDIIMQEDGSILNVAWGRANMVMPISKKFKIIAEGFLGFGTLGVDSTVFRFETGGMAKNRIEWYNSFPGLQYLEHGSNNVWIASISPRYEFYKNNFITAKFSLTAMDRLFENLFINASSMYAGASLKYGFYSMFGPMELSADYSFNNYNKSGYLSLGFWF